VEQNKRYTLGKTERLKSRKLIGELFTSGSSFSNFPFRVIWLPNEKAVELKTAFSVSVRFFKRATDRNRIKRLMREAWRLQKSILEDQFPVMKTGLYVFLIYTGNEMPVYQDIYEKTAIILKRLAEKNGSKKK